MQILWIPFRGYFTYADFDGILIVIIILRLMFVGNMTLLFVSATVAVFLLNIVKILITGIFVPYLLFKPITLENAS